MKNITFEELGRIERKVLSSKESIEFAEIKSIKFGLQEEIKRYLTPGEELDTKCPLPNKIVIDKLIKIGITYFKEKPSKERAFMVAQSIGIIICDYGWGTDYAVGPGLLKLTNEILNS